jgi:hypothetical protein
MKKNSFLRVVFLVVVVVGIVTYINGYIVFNDIPPVYDSAETEVMGNLTVEGTSLFLQSNADVFLLLNEVELGYGKDFDFAHALELTESAVDKLEGAKMKYRQIIARAGSSGYIAGRIRTLKTFNYTKLAETHQLNNEIMLKLKGYLVHGDIRGLYAWNIGNIDFILQKLNHIKSLLLEGKLPTVNTFWSLLHQYSDAILLGNYASMVFANLE